MKPTVRRGQIAADNCTIIPTSYARDMRLSLEARGLLAWMMSAPQPVTEEDILAAGPGDLANVRRMLAELAENGYIESDGARYALGAGGRA
jgi:DNA-binding IclR family transcriptional regulator